ncbi:PREDICTED: VQ motif-containing protein 1-like [Nicotiana attenuata]|uniref:Vq motif-containing protein 1 n=1 Tax=Nicotiana attenuata TaxID=49451 RepID=A0A1J6I904_NICAT|nr:PREDICTED: VQ motif-containing protein 1-like [Nicotiana attenuata]OIT01454.1 vq motif-containing protein 1 [Nicotiana attenuata]
MSKAAKNMRVPVKIVVINTQYIETDASSFKSVVQRLTGKNSNVELEATAAPPPAAAASYGGWNYQNGGTLMAETESNIACKPSPNLGRGMSFNDFDKLFKELPPLDDLLRLYADEFRSNY